MLGRTSRPTLRVIPHPELGVYGAPVAEQPTRVHFQPPQGLEQVLPAEHGLSALAGVLAVQRARPGHAAQSPEQHLKQLVKGQQHPQLQSHQHPHQRQLAPP